LKKLAIITTHPIQYNAPLFRLLGQKSRLDVKVFYTWGQSQKGIKYDPGFDRNVEWDIPLLEGYNYQFIRNTATDPGSHHFNGIKNPELIREIEKWNADVLLVFGWSYKSHLKVLRYFKKKKKILFRGDSTLLDEKYFSIKKIIRSLFLKWVYKHISKALFVGKANKEYFLKYGLKHEQLIFTPHAVDNQRYFTGHYSDRRSELGIPQDAIVFLFAGKFELKKNPGLLLDAFIQLKNNKTHLLFVGNGELEEKLKIKVSNIQEFTRNNIHFLPFQNQTKMPGIYKTGDVFVLPSQGPYETWGLSVNEAMASSRAVLVSDKCGCANDLVHSGINGFIFKHNELNDLTIKMKYLVASKDELYKMGQESFKLIQDWSYEKAMIAIESAI
jgi:glycosyltransferase involved in cell wall biosynthesis